MPQPLYPPGGPQFIGQVLDTGFRIFQVSLVRCLLYGAAGMIAGQLPNIYSILVNKAVSRLDFGDPAWVGLYVASGLLSLFIYAALVLRQHNIVTGRRQGMRADLAATFRRLPSILGLGAVGFVFGGLLLLFFSIASGNLAMSTGMRVGALVVGFALLLPATYFSVPFSFATPALLIDGKGALSSLAYALRLIKGNWWRTSLIYTMALVIIFAFYVVATIAAGALVLALAGADVVAMSAAPAVVYVALGALGLPFAAATVLATYGELKVRREAIDLEMRLGDVAHT
jgi:hypothetical protein